MKCYALFCRKIVCDARKPSVFNPDDSTSHPVPVLSAGSFEAG